VESRTTIGDVCFIRRNGKILLLCRNREPLKNKWTGVGGKTKFDEEPLESCVREVREETGLDIQPKLAGVLTTINKPKGSKWALFVYTARGCRGKLKRCREGTLEWVDEEKLYEKDLTGFIRVLLPHILKKGREGVVTGKIVHDEKGEVLRGVLREKDKILLKIP